MTNISKRIELIKQQYKKELDKSEIVCNIILTSPAEDRFLSDGTVLTRGKLKQSFLDTLDGTETNIKLFAAYDDDYEWSPA